MARAACRQTDPGVQVAVFSEKCPREPYGKGYYMHRRLELMANALYAIILLLTSYAFAFGNYELRLTPYCIVGSRTGTTAETNIRTQGAAAADTVNPWWPEYRKYQSRKDIAYLGLLASGAMAVGALYLESQAEQVDGMEGLKYLYPLVGAWTTAALGIGASISLWIYCDRKAVKYYYKSKMWERRRAMDKTIVLRIEW